MNSDDDERLSAPSSSSSVNQTDYGDGRDSRLKYGTLFPPPEAHELANKGKAIAQKFFATMRTARINDTDWLGTELSYIAEVYIRQGRYSKLPTADEYRSYAERVSRAARFLLQDIQVDEGKSWWIDQGLRQKAKMPLRRQSIYSPHSFEDILIKLLSICDDFREIRASTSVRPREDLRILVSGLADIWKRVTGRRCPTSIKRNKDKGDLDFEAEGPRFVHAVAKAFDPSLQPKDIATALRKRPARRPRSQPSPPE